MGRFLQTDPIGTRDDLNLYGYAGNSPLNALDPLGLACTYSSIGASRIGTLCTSDTATSDSQSVPPTKRDPAAEQFGLSQISTLASSSGEPAGAYIARDDDGNMTMIRSGRGAARNRDYRDQFAPKQEFKIKMSPEAFAEGVVNLHPHASIGGSIAPHTFNAQESDLNTIIIGGTGLIYQRDRILGERFGTLFINEKGVASYFIEGRIGPQEIVDTQKELDAYQPRLESKYAPHD